MERRTFIRAAGSTLLLLGATLRGRAQAPATTARHIGFLSLGSRASPAQLLEVYAPLRELGWIEGQNLIVERRNADGRAELLRPLAEELVRLNVEIIVTSGTDAAFAAKSATTIIPIVLLAAGDPVRAGLVASLARPGGNITGFSIVSPELDAKRLEVLHELLPTAQRVGVLVNPTNPISSIGRDDYERMFRSLGIELRFVEVSVPNKEEGAVETVARQRCQGMIVSGDNIFTLNRVALMRAALKFALPTMVPDREFLEVGGLLFYAHSARESNRRYAAFIDKILKGAKPADLPIEQPTQFELGINLKTAKALGLMIPQSLLVRADEVIQ
jgi:putative tryptophan/tyrosine transport system substrate-binding protein